MHRIYTTLTAVHPTVVPNNSSKIIFIVYIFRTRMERRRFHFYYYMSSFLRHVFRRVFRVSHFHFFASTLNCVHNFVSMNCRCCLLYSHNSRYYRQRQHVFIQYFALQFAHQVREIILNKVKEHTMKIRRMQHTTNIPVFNEFSVLSFGTVWCVYLAFLYPLN